MLSIIWQLHGCFYYREEKSKHSLFEIFSWDEVIITYIHESYEYWEIGAGKIDGLILSGPKDLQDLPSLEQEGANSICAPRLQKSCVYSDCYTSVDYTGSQQNLSIPLFPPQ